MITPQINLLSIFYFKTKILNYNFNALLLVISTLLNKTMIEVEYHFFYPMAN